MWIEKIAYHLGFLLKKAGKRRGTKLKYEADGSVILPFPNPLHGVFAATGIPQVLFHLEQQFESLNNSRIVPKKVRLVGLIFGHSANSMMRNEIIPKAEYWHYRSSVFVDFFCMGYFRTEMRFDSAEFYNAIAELEAKTRWKYSGETDLILVNALRVENNAPLLDFADAISVTLENTIREKCFPSAGYLVEKIVEITDKATGCDLNWDCIASQAGSSPLEELAVSLFKPFQCSQMYSQVGVRK